MQRLQSSVSWVKALSALSVNISAALFLAAAVGPTVSSLKTHDDFIVLTLYIVFATLFLLITVFLEGELKENA